MTPSPQTWLVLWIEGLGGAPGWIVATMGLVLAFFAIILPTAAVTFYLDRKMSADFQGRVGPNRAGPAGIFQPVADLLKLLQKCTVRDWSWREALWLSVHTMALYSTVALLPLGSLVLLVDTDMSALLPFWAALVVALGTMFLGLSQDSVPGWFGGIRVAAQALAGAFPALVALVAAGLPVGGFRWSSFVAAQGASPLAWTAFSNPFQFIAFVVFLVGGLVLLGIPPMEPAIEASDIRGGVASHLSGRRLTLFRLGRFYAFFLWSVITAVLFLGAWNLPFGFGEALRDSGSLRLLQILEVSVVMVKAYALILLVVWVARVNPRSRVDQTTDFAWKVLSPFALVALLGAAVFAGWGAFQ